MPNDAEKLLMDVLAKAQRNDRLRKALAGLLLLALLGVALHFIIEMLPRSHTLRITGGDLLSNRHFLAKSLQAEAVHRGLGLQVIPVRGSQEALEQVDQRAIDLAFVQGGLGADFPNVTHVATIAPELLHVLVRPGIQQLSDLRSKRINLGSKTGGTRVIAKEVLEFSGLEEGLHYTEVNLSSEELVSLPVSQLPDVVVLTSFAPSDLADFLVKNRDYSLLELPFPKSLATRLGWVAESRITAYMYKVSPPVPPRDVQTIGVHLHLVAHKDTDPRAVFKTLETLYSAGVEQRLRMRLDERDLTVPSGFPLSRGTQMYLDRNNPLFSTATLDRIKALFGLVLSLASTVLVVLKWFRGAPPPVSTDDSSFADMIGRIRQLELDLDASRGAGYEPEAWSALQSRIGGLRDELMQRLPQARLSNPLLAQHALAAVQHLQLRLEGARHA